MSQNEVLQFLRKERKKGRDKFWRVSDLDKRLKIHSSRSCSKLRNQGYLESDSMESAINPRYCCYAYRAWEEIEND